MKLDKVDNINDIFRIDKVSNFFKTDKVNKKLCL